MYKPLRQLARATAKGIFRSFGLNLVSTVNTPGTTLAGLWQRPVHTVIDCGANQGQFARHISSFYPDAIIYCFEPLSEPYDVLNTWAATQRGRVQCFQVALGDREGEATMNFHVDHSPSSSMLPTTEHEETAFPQTRKQSQVTVRQTTLDIVLAEMVGTMRAQILLKLDVQGYEDRVLRGAIGLLSKVDACLLEVCVDPLYTAQATFKDLVLLLDEHGLSYAGNVDQSYGEDGRVMWLDALFVRRL